MNIASVSALLNMYREKGVISARNQHGQIIFYGLGRITGDQKSTLLNIPQADLNAAMKWQGR